MIRKNVLCALLWLGTVVVLFGAVPSSDVFLAEADAGAKKSPSRAKLYERHVLRQREHALQRHLHHNMRVIAREKRHIGYIKRELHHHPKIKAL